MYIFIGHSWFSFYQCFHFVSDNITDYFTFVCIFGLCASPYFRCFSHFYVIIVFKYFFKGSQPQILNNGIFLFFLSFFLHSTIFSPLFMFSCFVQTIESKIVVGLNTNNWRFECLWFSCMMIWMSWRWWVLVWILIGIPIGVFWKINRSGSRGSATIFGKFQKLT